LGQKDIFQDIRIECFISQDFWISTGNQDYNSSYPCQNGTRKSNRKKASFSGSQVPLKFITILSLFGVWDIYMQVTGTASVA
jgi:hypothetical protein